MIFCRRPHPFPVMRDQDLALRGDTLERYEQLVQAIITDRNVWRGMASVGRPVFEALMIAKRMSAGTAPAPTNPQTVVLGRRVSKAKGGQP